jgi:hypothetical protein
MPNWCENILTIENCSAELTEYLTENGLSFEKIKPTPPEMLEDDGWYGWRVENWGTKWDLTEEEQRDVADKLVREHNVVLFCTPYSPPSPAIVALSEMFPNDLFKIEYYEYGLDLAGTDYIKAGVLNGNILQDEEEIRLFAADVFGYDNEEIMEKEAMEP